MTSDHPAYRPLTEVVAALKDEPSLDTGQREQLRILHGALEGYEVPFHKEDVRAIHKALHAVARRVAGPSIYSHKVAQQWDREQREKGRR